MGQLRQPDAAAVVAYEPEPQLEHVVAPVTAVYMPATQPAQLEAPTFG